MALVPKALQVLGEELAIVWSDGAESYLPLTTVRRLCPCAGCAGERDLLGRLAKFPEKPLTKESFQAVSTVPSAATRSRSSGPTGTRTGSFLT